MPPPPGRRGPLTQIPIPKHELQRLDSVVQAAGQRLPPVSALRGARSTGRRTTQCISTMTRTATRCAIFTNLDLYAADYAPEAGTPTTTSTW